MNKFEFHELFQTLSVSQQRENRALWVDLILRLRAENIFYAGNNMPLPNKGRTDDKNDEKVWDVKQNVENVIGIFNLKHSTDSSSPQWTFSNTIHLYTDHLKFTSSTLSLKSNQKVQRGNVDWCEASSMAPKFHHHTYFSHFCHRQCWKWKYASALCIQLMSY